MKSLPNIIKSPETFKILEDIKHETLARLIYHLENYPKSKNIYVLINSHGGNANIALSIYSILKESNAITVGLNTVQSAGFTIFLGGVKRMCLDNTAFMYHNVKSNRLWDNLTGGGYLGATEKPTIKLYNSYGLSVPHPRGILNSQMKFISAQEALQKNIVHKLI